MNTEVNTKAGYRYPGFRPFYDNEIDRHLFFGRDNEKESLLHKVLADNLVVMYARSGLGKTSLINAGLNQALRKRGYIPLKIRLNNPKIKPLQGVYQGIKEIVKQKGTDYEPGEEDSLWQYFKTAAFWSEKDKLLKPVLILDQFEEFFMFYSSDSRKSFIQQLADLVNNNIPKEILQEMQSGEPFPYSDKPPNVKILFSLREDYLGYLEEMSTEIPTILTNRFRLLPLSREQAKQAITEPSRVQDEAIHASSFKYSQDSLDMMLDFLCQRKEMGNIIKTDEVEPFQLQIICQNIESKVIQKTSKGEENIMIQEDDLGGESGMKEVLKNYYDDQIKKLGTLWTRRRVRKLFEKGMISPKGYRLSQQNEQIERNFKVKKGILDKLVGYRLLRSEPRLGKFFYELSHDTLVDPIRESQKKRKTKKIKRVCSIFTIFVLLVVATAIFFGTKYRINAYMSDGYLYNQKGEYNKAIKSFKKAIEIKPKFVDAYLSWGAALVKQKKYNEASELFKKAIKIDPKYPYAYNNMGNALLDQGKYKGAIEEYKKAIELKPEYADAHYNMGNAYYDQEIYNEAIIAYTKAINIDNKVAIYYHNLGLALAHLKKYNEAIDAFNKAVDIDPEHVSTKVNLAEAYLLVERFEDAFALANELLKRKNISISFNLAMRFVSISALLFQGKKPEAAAKLKELTNYYKSIPGEYKRDWSYSTSKDFIKNNKKLQPQETRLLLQLIDLLESPKAEGDKKIKEFETAVFE